MSSGVGLRDERLRLYERSDNGTDGFVRPVFSFVYERWGRIDETTVSSRVTAERVQMKTDAEAQFDYRVTIPVGGVIKDGDGTMWWIRSIDPMRGTMVTVVGVDRVSAEEVATFQLYDADNVLDGVHLVDPA